MRIRSPFDDDAYDWCNSYYDIYFLYDDASLQLAMVTGQPYDGTAVDVWCCGVVLYALVSGYTPFECVGDKKLKYLDLVKVMQLRILKRPLEIARPTSLAENSICWLVDAADN